MKNLSKQTFNCYTSNSFKNLVQICSNNIKDCSYQSKVYLAYPSNEGKDFFVQSFIEENSQIFGIRFITIQQFVHLSLKICYGKDLLFPSHYELMFFLEEEIFSLLQSDNEIASPLKEYIQDKKSRVSSLASSLSHIFLDYLLYGRKVLNHWLENKLWQQYLFQKVTSRWTSIINAIENSPKPKFGMNMHIFCIDQCPELYLQFFQRLSPTISFSFYFFSPSPFFWGDLISEKKAAYLDRMFQKQRVCLNERLEFANYLKGSSPLLSHFCDHAKPLYLYLNEHFPEETYEDITIESNLHYIQKSILYQTHSNAPPFKDNSFSLHCAPSILREVEMVINAIEQTLYEHKDLTPNDISVLAPNIDLYYPFISYLFANNSYSFSFTISNLCLVKHNPEMNSLYLLFSLIESRFEKDDLLKLFSSPHFQKRSWINEEDIKILEKIISHTGIRFGYDRQSKDTILDADSSCSFGLFEKGFSYILNLIAEKNSPIEFSETESIGDLIFLTKSLFEDIKDFKGDDQTLEQWLEKTISFANKYLYLEENESIFFKELKKITSLAKESSFLFSYASFSKMFKEIFSKKGGFEKTYEKPPITFSSIENSPPMNKTLFFIGFDEESFPKKETKRSLHELIALKDYEKQTNNTKTMRYFLLKSIFSTKKSIYFSYCCKNPADGRERNYSLLMEELIHALNLDPPIIHPISSYCPTYFAKPHVAKHAYSLMLASKSNFSLNFPEFDVNEEKPSQMSVECKDLSLLFTSPSKFFYNLSTNLYENTKHCATSSDDNEFTLSYLDRAIFKKKKLIAFDSNLQFNDLISTNKLPCGLFQQAATKELTLSIGKEKSLIKKYVNPSNPFISLCLDPHIKKPIQKDNTYFFPSINITFNGCNYQIQGMIPNITEKGLLCFKKDSVSEIWKQLPTLIILANINCFIETNIIFLQTGETKVFDRNDLKKLTPTILIYYEKALQNLSPIIPEAIAEYIEKKTISYSLLKEKILSAFSDPYLEKANPIDYTHFENELSLLTKIIQPDKQLETQ